MMTLGYRQFKTKKDVKARIRALIASATLETPLIPDLFIGGLLALHPHKEDKIGCGVQHFFVRESRVCGRLTRCFWIKRKDGSEVDFSWLICLRPPTKRENVLSALRFAVEDVMWDFKRAAFRNGQRPTCDVSGKTLSINACDVHHDPPFIQLAEAFVAGRWDDFHVLAGKADEQLGGRLPDDVRDAWIEYHNTHGGLRLIDRKCHIEVTQKA